MRNVLRGAGVPACVAFSFVLYAQETPGKLTPDQKEQFLLHAKVVKVHSVAKGITNTVRVTMTDGTITHDASVQRIDEAKPVFQASDGTSEINFKDSYRYNIAAWRLAKLLGIGDMVPPSVARKYDGQQAAFTWWIDDVMMDGVQKQKDKSEPPNVDSYNDEMYVLRVFDELIYNTDRNLTNVLIDQHWQIWMIDHTRAFRLQKSLRTPKDLVKCDRTLLEKLKAMDEPTLDKALEPYATKSEIRGLLSRRDQIVKVFEQKGASALYNRPPRI